MVRSFHGEPAYGSDPRLLSIPNLCSMYDVFQRERMRLLSLGADSGAHSDDLRMIVSALQVRLAENLQAEIDMGWPNPLKHGKEESE